MGEQENARIVRALFENLNTRQLDASDQYIAEDYQALAPGWPGPYNRDQVKGTFEANFKAFPDLRYDLLDIIAQGDKVAATWEVHGTHTGPLQTPAGNEYPPTGKPVHFKATTVSEFRAGKLLRQETYFDQVVLMSQLGLIGEAQGRA